MALELSELLSIFLPSLDASEASISPRTRLMVETHENRILGGLRMGVLSGI